jgi:hypothetical protein
MSRMSTRRPHLIEFTGFPVDHIPVELPDGCFLWDRTSGNGFAGLRQMRSTGAAAANNSHKARRTVAFNPIRRRFRFEIPEALLSQHCCPTWIERHQAPIPGPRTRIRPNTDFDHPAGRFLAWRPIRTRQTPISDAWLSCGSRGSVVPWRVFQPVASLVNQLGRMDSEKEGRGSRQARCHRSEAMACSVLVIDRTPAKLAIHDVGFPDILTQGKSHHEAQAIHRRTDYFDSEGARGRRRGG